MAKLAGAALAAAAVVVVALGAVRLMSSSVGPGGGAPTPTPTPAASQAPSTSLSPPSAFLATGPLEPGTYLYDQRAGTYMYYASTYFSFTVPAGWAADQEVSIWKHPGTPQEVSFVAWDVTHIFPDACQWQEDQLVPAGATAAELSTQLAAQTGRLPSATTDVLFGGIPAKRIGFTNDPAVDFATCTGGGLRLWPGAGPTLSGGECCFAQASIDEISIVDVDGRHIVIVARHLPGSSAADVDELHAMVDSIRFDSAEAGSAAP
jgi:hypothetical protein